MSKSQFILVKYMYIFPNGVIHNKYHDYLLVATAECFVLCIK